FQHVTPQTFMGLFLVPRTAVFSAECRHHGDEFGEGVRFRPFGPSGLHWCSAIPSCVPVLAPEYFKGAVPESVFGAAPSVESSRSPVIDDVAKLQTTSGLLLLHRVPQRLARLESG